MHTNVYLYMLSMYNPYSTVILWYFIVLLSTLKQGSANHSLWTKKNTKLPVFVNRILLKHIYPHSFTYCLWLLSTTAAELKSCDRDCMACKAKTFFNYLGLYGKSLHSLLQTSRSQNVTSLRNTWTAC